MTKTVRWIFGACSVVLILKVLHLNIRCSDRAVRDERFRARYFDIRRRSIARREIGCKNIRCCGGPNEESSECQQFIDMNVNAVGHNCP